ncbi:MULTISPECIES: sugar ABC transporter permease [unclassified Chelatococcus]|uniref:carbohydrate ABC transporter permease n=1 Tax=unclassified Chelatococcus TaxID=2638111 RepID=UPI001BCC8956|nr:MULTISPECIES: sugar ABC transporter permease [unclassified Chelatococcus]MBS7700585.1 sugar ABC transporter permease [Chelatococcus sp. YT9]MBX3558700.1 sugar ABC transporter permease [Chelatococcus sp.]
MRRADWPVAYQMLVPALLLEGAFVLAPLAIGFWYSLHNVRFFRMRSFVWLDNYWSIITSPLVVNSLVVTVIFSVAALVLTFAIGFGLAVWLQRDTAGHVAMRAIVLVPYMIAMLVGSMLLKWIFAQESGLTPLLLGPFGYGNVSILSDPKTAMAALVYNAMWRDSAFAMIMLLAGLKSLPVQIFQAARVDGASPFYIFRRITLPLLRIPILITLVRLFIHFINTLTFPLILTGGGPANATETVVLRMFRLGFQDNVLGQANALAVLIFAGNIILVAVLLLLFRQAKRL